MYALVGGAAAATVGPWLVLVLLGCGLAEIAVVAAGPARDGPWLPLLAAQTGGLGALAWIAFKVGALSYGGGFVIVPLMQADAVDRYHWLTDAQFLNAVALGQITPGPVTHTVAAVGYGAAGRRRRAARGGDRVRALVRVRARGRPLVRARSARTRTPARSSTAPARPRSARSSARRSRSRSRSAEWWQVVLLAVAAVALLVLRRGVVVTLLALGVAGAVLVATHAVSLS